MVQVEPGQNRLRAVLDIAENALTVAHIATIDIWLADPQMSVADASSYMLSHHFDAAALSEDPIWRYVHVDDLQDPQALIGDLARPIEVSNLVTSTLSLTEAIVALKRHPFFFVLAGNRLMGMVTRSDLQRPAVSMVTFSISLAAEAGLTQLIQRIYGDDWFANLPQGRQVYVSEIFEDRHRSNAEILRLDCMMLEDRLCLVGKRPVLWRELGFESRHQFETWADTLKDLRNTLAHGGDLLDVRPQPIEAIDLFEKLAVFGESVYRAVSQAT